MQSYLNCLFLAPFPDRIEVNLLAKAWTVGLEAHKSTA